MINQILHTAWTSKELIQQLQSLMTKELPVAAIAKLLAIGQTKIVAECDDGYRETGVAWYEQMTNLGYTEHRLLAADVETAAYFDRLGMRYDSLVPPQSSTTLNNTSTPSSQSYTSSSLFRDPYYTNETFCPSPGKSKGQVYRRWLFTSRWLYVYYQLVRGYHVLLVDVDNVFLRHVPMATLEDEHEQTDIFHAYCQFPLRVIKKHGAAVCGGMAWLRASEPTIRYVKMLLARCDMGPPDTAGLVGADGTRNSTGSASKSLTTQPTCGRPCDDQVAMNGMVWEGIDMHWSSNYNSSYEASKWHPSIMGSSNMTKHKVKLWSADFAFRGPLEGLEGRCPIHPWVVMPTWKSTEERHAGLQIWNNGPCGSSSGSSTATTTGTNNTTG
jgi:hypothetical protein